MNASALDAITQFKQMQKESWANFAPIEVFTTEPAAQLVKFAGIRAGQRVLDVGCGTGVTAITAARLGAHVIAIDLTPQLLDRARENSRIAGVAVEFQEADAETLPFPDQNFDVVISQFAHMFAPRPEVATAEMLRILKPGGTIAFSTWPPELLVGRMMSLPMKYMPPPPAEIPSPILWGDPNIVRQRLGSAVKDLVFDRNCMRIPALSPQHLRGNVERTVGPLMKLVEMLSAKNPEALRQFRAEFDALTTHYMEDNIVRQDYLMTRAIKA
jgi:SAM-dependent methyltransferase